MLRTCVLVLTVLFLSLSLACNAPARIRSSGPAASPAGDEVLATATQSATDEPTSVSAPAAVVGVLPANIPAAPAMVPTTAPAQPSDWIARVDAALRARMKVSNLPLAGLSAAVQVGDAASVTFSYGMANIAQGLPVSPDTPFQVASVTKQFTATAIMQLVEADKLSLDDPAVRFFPDLTPSASAAAQGVTVRHLLTHTSGLPDPLGWKFRDFEIDQAIPNGDDQVDLASVFGQPAASPGDRWSYNNTGFWILGRIVETVSGEDYGSYLQTHVFQPLGMRHTGYCPDAQPGAATGYDYNPDTRELHPVKGDMRLAFSAGGLCSTPSDLLIWQQALASGQVVRPESYRQMITPVQLNNGSAYPYGFGLNVTGQGDQAVIWHSGILCGFQSTLVHFAQGDITIAVLVNTDGSQGAGDIARRVILPEVEKK